MPSRLTSVSTVTDVNVTTVNETAAIVSDPVSQSVDGEAVTISGRIGLLTGTGTTAVTIRVREGNGITGNVIGETLPKTIAAAVDDQVAFSFTYNPAGIAGMRYTATVQQTAASANGTIKSAAMTVQVGNT
jgi:hypothetical protein